MAMAMRPFGRTGDSISLLGFGCMRLPTVGGDANAVDVAATRRMVDYALDHGVNYFDTANPYHGGRSETVIGEVLSAHPRDRYRLATKMPPWRVKEEADVDRIFDEQLRKCRVDHFDFYLVHNLNRGSLKTCRRTRMFDTLQKRKERGQIRRLGFSFHDAPEALDTMLPLVPWDFAQIQLNYLDWTLQDAKGQYERLERAGIPVAVMEPLRGGTLARLTDRAVAVLREANPAASPASWALRYAASLPGVYTVLSGMSDFAQLEDNVATMEDFRPLDDAERAVIGKALALYREAGAIPCTACRYCMECPSGVDIPRLFALFNHFRAGGERWFMDMEYYLVPEPGRANRCTKCGVCVPKCPQGIDIPARLAEIAAMMAKR